MTTREEALAIVREYVKNESLVRHMLAVEAAVRWYARKLGEDEERWGLAALLHDFDWEIHPDLERHPRSRRPDPAGARHRGRDHRGYPLACRPYRRAAGYPPAQGAGGV